MKITLKLTAAFLTISIFSIFVGLIGLNGILQIESSFETIIHETTPELLILNNISNLSQKIHLEVIILVMHFDSVEFPLLYDDDIDRYNQAKLELNQEIHNLEQLEDETIFNNDDFDKNEEEFIAQIRVLREEFYSSSQNLIDATRSGEDSAKIFELNDELGHARKNFDNLLQQRISEELIELEQKNTLAKQLSDNFSVIMVAFGIFGAILGIFFALVIARSIITSIKNLDYALQEFRNDKYRGNLAPSGDVEIRHIMESFNDMVKNLNSQNQKLLRAEKLYTIGQLASRMAHDLRNPMSVIQGTVEILGNMMSGDKKIQPHLDRMNTAVARMVHQIDNVLDYVKSKNLKLAKNEITPIVNSVFESLKLPENIIVEKYIKNFAIFCDSHLLRIVFVNLIVNAIHAIGDRKDGKIKIIIDEKDHENIVIKIEDNGSGIPDDVLPQIFEPLFTTKQEGTGLGLASCKNIVDRHGGTLTVSNNPTIFSITLPKHFDLKK